MNTCYNSQSTHIFAIPGGGGGGGPTHIYVSDRFEPYITENRTGTYVWLPLTWEGEGAGSSGGGAQPVVEWHDEWRLP